MATVKQCDRCEKLIGVEDRYEGTTPIVPYARIFRKSSHGTAATEIDLCPSCMRELDTVIWKWWFE